MPTVSVYMNDEDYNYYKSLDKKAAVLHWAFDLHRKAALKKITHSEPTYYEPEVTA